MMEGFVIMNTIDEHQLLSRLAIGSVYQHYSGKQYRVITVGRHSEDLSLYVIYEALYDGGDLGQVWMRPLAMFLEEVEIHGSTIRRFSKVTELS